MVEQEFEWNDRKWHVGQFWGMAHPNPKHNCYHSAEAMDNIEGVYMFLDIKDEPKFFEEIQQTKEYGVGYMTSVDEYLYGDFYFQYSLPIGINLWPAIWMSSKESWPPEIDIMEGWSGKGFFKKDNPDYKKIWFLNDIYPSLHYGTKDDHKIKTFGSFPFKKYTYSSCQRLHAYVTCRLLWEPEHMRIWYDGHKVLDFKDATILSEFNKPMVIHVNTYIDEDFKKEDFAHYEEYGKGMSLLDFQYKPVKYRL